MSRDFHPGSLWRRWDLHIHTPGTALSDNFKGWPSYLKKLEQAPSEIAVLGITDYLSIRGYESVLSFRKEGRLSNISLIVPNIEFRISPETRNAKGINLHLLISPDPIDHCERINEALSRLTIKIQRENIPCNRNGFIRLGRSLGKGDLDEEAAYREGVNQYKVSFERFRDWWLQEEWLRVHSLVAVAAGSHDGTSGLQHDSGFKAVRIEIEKFAHIVFSGKPKDRQFWLGRGPLNVDELSDVYGGPKPCLHGSDAHEENRLFRPDQDRFCWIKADPTFDGLRQTIFEPDERVFIGIEPPQRHNSDNVISGLKIGNTCGWFSTDRIRLNPGFVAIIGSKGSGKTALADLVAAAAGAEVDPEDSFLSRASDHLEGLTADLQWLSGRVSNLSVPLDEDLWSYQADVHYLSQKFVEKLCAGNDIGEALKAEIEHVVFGHLPDDKTMSASSFRELRDELTGGLRARRAEIRGDISTLNEEISRIDREETQNPIKQRRIVELEKQLGELKKQYPKIEDTSTKKVLSELEKARQEQKNLTEGVAQLRSKQQTLDNVERRVRQFAMSQGEFWTEIQEEFRLLGMPAKDIEAFRPGFRGDTALPIETLRATFKDQITKLLGQGGTGNPQPDSVEYWKSQVARLEQQVGLDEEKRKKLIALQRQAGNLEKDIFNAKRELQNFESVLTPRRKQAVEKRFRIYLEYFELLEEEVRILAELYEPLRASLMDKDEHEKKLTLYIRTSADIGTWVSRGEELIDQRKAGPFRVRGSLLEETRRYLAKPWEVHDTAKIKAGITHLIQKFRSAGSIKEQLCSEYDLVDLADWLFSVDHIELEYGLRYDGVELQKLSPGTKGIVLLILYLAIDTRDQRPLIVDQPDENLDNESIYKILRSYFRIAKTRRQIILITHNPNLVVNTDADQVIVASANRQPSGLPSIGYFSGSLESIELDPETGQTIRERVCQLLEGGREAFDMRERKYRFDEDYIH